MLGEIGKELIYGTSNSQVVEGFFIRDAVMWPWHETANANHGFNRKDIACSDDVHDHTRPTTVHPGGTLHKDILLYPRNAL
jgi:hypothetical protein